MHDIIKQCHGNYKEMKKFNYKLEIGIFRNYTQKYLGSWGVLFKGLGVQKGTQTPCWLRPWTTSIHEQKGISSRREITLAVEGVLDIHSFLLSEEQDWTHNAIDSYANRKTVIPFDA